MKSFLFKEFCLLRECGEIVLSEGKKFFWVWKYEKKLSLDISLIFTLEFEKCIFFKKENAHLKLWQVALLSTTTKREGCKNISYPDQS